MAWNERIAQGPLIIAAFMVSLRVSMIDPAALVGLALAVARHADCQGGLTSAQRNPTAIRMVNCRGAAEFASARIQLVER